MKLNLIFVLGVWISSCALWAQDSLVNIHNSYSEVYGGMEDSGVDRKESYRFVATGSLTLCDIYLDGKKLQLSKNDTLEIILSVYLPYNAMPTDSPEAKAIPQPDEKERYRVVKSGSSYFAFVQYPYIWPREICYVSKKKSRTAKPRNGFDSGQSYAAP